MESSAQTAFGVGTQSWTKSNMISIFDASMISRRQNPDLEKLHGFDGFQSLNRRRMVDEFIRLDEVLRNGNLGNAGLDNYNLLISIAQVFYPPLRMSSTLGVTSQIQVPAAAPQLPTEAPRVMSNQSIGATGQISTVNQTTTQAPRATASLNTRPPLPAQTSGGPALQNSLLNDRGRRPAANPKRSSRASKSRRSPNPDVSIRSSRSSNITPMREASLLRKYPDQLTRTEQTQPAALQTVSREVAPVAANLTRVPTQTARTATQSPPPQPATHNTQISYHLIEATTAYEQAQTRLRDVTTIVGNPNYRECSHCGWGSFIELRGGCVHYTCTHCHQDCCFYCHTMAHPENELCPSYPF